MNKTHTRVLATKMLGLLAKEQSCKLILATAVPGTLLGLLKAVDEAREVAASGRSGV